MSAKSFRIPNAFIWRRVHSLLGLWLVVYLIEHLTVNSQAALWIGNDGAGFVRLVNLIQHLPFIRFIEITLIGVPILVHGVWGVKRLFTSKTNVYPGNGSKPSLQYERNHAYTWQRISSWILLFGIIFHVIQMRFLDEPLKVMKENQERYLVKLNFDEGLYTLAPRLGVQLFDREKIEKLQESIAGRNETLFFSSSTTSPERAVFDSSEEEEMEKEMLLKQNVRWVEALESFSLKNYQVVADAPSPGTAILLTTRDTFKSPFMGILYTVFVLAAAFHGFNGLWTFLITWGAILSMRSQKSMVNVCYAVMAIFLFLGLAAIWGSYWINLRS